MYGSRANLRGEMLVVASLATIAFFVSGVGSVATGMFINPMMIEFGWTNAETSAVAPAYTLSSLLATPAIGLAIDRIGARAVMSVGILIAAAGYVLASRCHSWNSMVAAFVLIGTGYAASFYLPTTVIIADHLTSKRSLGMGVVLGAASVGAALLSPLAGWFMEKRGWRDTLEMGGFIIALTLPLLLLTTSAQRSPKSATSNESAQSPKLHGAVLFSPLYLALVASSGLFALGMNGLQYHVVPVLIRAGLSVYASAWVFGATWLLSSLGSLLLGITADKLGPRKILAVALLCGACGTLFLLPANTSLIGITCVAAFVLLWGASANAAFQLVPIILAERFGARRLGSTVGIQAAAAGIVGAAGPIATGFIYDHTKSYAWAICLSAAATAAAFLVALGIMPHKPSAARTSMDGSSSAGGR